MAFHSGNSGVAGGALRELRFRRLHQRDDADLPDGPDPGAAIGSAECDLSEGRILERADVPLPNVEVYEP
jgi:hypothetical protein